MVWYSNLLQNFPQFIVIHTVKGFGLVNKYLQRPLETLGGKKMDLYECELFC